MAGPEADDPETKEEEEETHPNPTDGDPTATATAKAKAKPKPSIICPYCNKNGHKTTKAKNCNYSTTPGSVHYSENNAERATGK
jgi:hypothetical protein